MSYMNNTCLHILQHNLIGECNDAVGAEESFEALMSRINALILTKAMVHSYNFI